MKVPPDWKDRLYYHFEEPEDDGVKHNILVTIENQDEISDLEKYADIQIKAVKTELQGYQELKRRRVTLSNHLPAYELVYK